MHMDPRLSGVAMTLHGARRSRPYSRAKRSVGQRLLAIVLLVTTLGSAIAIELWLARAFDDHLIATIFILIGAVIVIPFVSPIFMGRGR